jgi:hypothetical protein
MQLGYGKPANQMDKFHYHRLWKMKHIFENLVLRDLLVFAGAHNARILHHADDTGIEADAVYRDSSILIVICATTLVGYITDNGVKIVSVGCLKD